MPREFVEFFMRFLTDEGDLVLDPFGGSNTTGAVAEEMKRKWLTIEAKWEYATASISRFKPDSIKGSHTRVEVVEA